MGSVDQSDIRIFKGIPYAQPPVGNLRWRPPVAPVSFGTLPATTFGFTCPQPIDPTNLGITPTTPENEDCLTLNIWTPANDTMEKRAVMVWIHGGGFYVGGSSEAVYDSNALARHHPVGGVVLVTINYRLGALGFLAHPELTAESGTSSSGNYGLMDQIFALQWVRDNIVKFGGNPNNITIFGQSAGAVSVTSLMTSARAIGLFHKAIAHSGHPPTLNSLATMEAAGVSYATERVCSTVACLRGLSSTILGNRPLGCTLEGTPPTCRFPSGGGTKAHLGIDGYVLTASPAAVFAQRMQQSIPFMTGTTAKEQSILNVNRDGVHVIDNFDKYRCYLRATFCGQLCTATPPCGAAITALSLYPAPGMTTPAAQAAYDDLTTDLFRLGARRAARNMAARKMEADPPRKVYLYSFEHESPAAVPYGPHHSSELPYTFYTLAQAEAQNSLPDKTLSQAMLLYWTRFARNASPNGSEAVAWPIFTELGDQHINLNLSITPGVNLRKQQLDFLDPP